ncbi:MAG: MarR family EPS-associated transcriptional regulator [Desulfatiglandaceae bacterium]
MLHECAIKLLYVISVIVDLVHNLRLDMAKKMGISVGKVNFCISELAKKGLIKVKRFKSAKNKLPYSYMLTPRGIEEKGRITVRFLKRKIEEYEEIKCQIGSHRGSGRKRSAELG